MFDAIAPRYELVNRVMTFGMDRGWRRRAVAELGLGRGELVLDLACGTGDLCRELREAGYRNIGFDISAGMLACARASGPLVEADALRMPLAAGVADGIVCGFALRNFSDLECFLAEAARVLRPAGRAVLLDVSIPEGRFLRRGHSAYFDHVVPRIGGLLSDPSAYRYLPRSVAYLPSSPELVAIFGDSGFVSVHRRTLSGGIAQIISGTRKGS
jgi:demethylmenaquinone methyltransferase/2-methoxy-6-polyprenyl-1,4-benzoquinol methylase